MLVCNDVSYMHAHQENRTLVAFACEGGDMLALLMANSAAAFAAAICARFMADICCSDLFTASLPFCKGLDAMVGCVGLDALLARSGDWPTSCFPVPFRLACCACAAAFFDVAGASA